MMAFSLNAFLLSVVLFWCADASIPRVGKSAVDASDEITNFALHFDSSEEGLKEVFSNLYNDLFHEDGSSKKKTVNDPDGFHCYKGNVKAKSSVVYFNLSDFHKGNDELFQKAEILLELTIPLSKHPYLISLYDMDTKTKLAHAEVLPGATRQWLVFPVTLIVPDWIRKPRTNHAIQLVIERKIDGVMFATGEERGVFRLPLLVIYTTRVSVPTRTRRHDVTQERRPEKKLSLEKGTCSKRALHVDLSQFLGDLVVHPLTYNAYTCAGKCKDPFKSNRQNLFTNHAIAQYRMQKLNLRNNNADFCCVPYKYESLSILQFSDETKNHLVLRRYTEMIVTECKCVAKEKTRISSDFPAFIFS